jgi:hypothetical protein
MSADELLALITAGGQAMAAIVDLVAKARAALSAEDAATVDGALAALQAQNDAAFTRLDGELAEAASG